VEFLVSPQNGIPETGGIFERKWAIGAFSAGMREFFLSAPRAGIVAFVSLRFVAGVRLHGY
jgi:hypothetical protein